MIHPLPLPPSPQHSAALQPLDRRPVLMWRTRVPVKQDVAARTPSLPPFHASATPTSLSFLLPPEHPLPSQKLPASRPNLSD